MKSIKMLILSAFVMVLAGCKTELLTRVNVSDLTNNAIANVPGAVRIEVPSCTHHEDSRRPSDSLVQMQEAVTGVFLGAEFEECYRSGMNSWAQFALPFAISRERDSLSSTSTVNLTASENLPLGVAVPSELVERMDSAKRSNPMFGGFDLAMSIDVINDGDTPWPVTVLSAWVDDLPLTLHGVDVPPGESIRLTLSDVLIDRAIQTGQASVLIDFESLVAQRNQ